jgi:phospholipid/cholesterol/gamma-HCH transport system substrate-binding protein
METRPPTVTRILVAVGFAISCFGLLLFLWLAFGGPIPLKPEGYRFTVPFDEATQLAVESDVRISGVSVGKVKRVDLDDQGLAEATIELDDRYAPVPVDTRAILRQKTLLGETYVELTPGSDETGMLEEGGDLPAAQVSDAVQLDEIFRAFDDRTRAAFQSWMQGQAAALRGKGDDLSVAIASLDPFVDEADRILRVLDSQRLAVREFIRSGGETFEALSERRGQLSGLISNAEQVFATTARRNENLADAFVAFPTFLRESRATLTRLERFAVDTDPLVQQLRPAAQELGPTVTELGRLSPPLQTFFTGLLKASNAAPRGFPALRRLLDDDLPPLLGRVETFLPQLNAILEGVRQYRREVAAFLGNVSAATNLIGGTNPLTGENLRFLRTQAPLGPEALAVFPNRLQYNRTNPYVAPGGYSNLNTFLRSFETRQCASGIRALLDPADAGAFPGDLFARIQQFAFAGETDSNALPTPPCTQQAPFDSIGTPSEQSDYLHVRPLP